MSDQLGELQDENTRLQEIVARQDFQLHQIVGLCRRFKTGFLPERIFAVLGIEDPEK